MHTPHSNHIRALGLLGVFVLAAVPLACADDETGDAASAGTRATTTVPDGPIEVTAQEFAFDGMPETLPAGTHSIRLTNEGQEPHELLIFQNPEGLTFEEIFALGPVEGPKHIAAAGMVQAVPGQAAESPFALTPGEWEVICFIPTADGTSHFSHGMHQTLTVS